MRKDRTILCSRFQKPYWAPTLGQAWGPRNDKGSVPGLRELSASFNNMSVKLTPGHITGYG